MPVGSTAHWTRLWQRYLLGTTVLWPLVLEHFYLDAVQPSFSRRAFKKRSTSGYYLCNRYYLKVNRLDVEWRKFSRFFHWNVRLLHSQLGCCVFFFKTRICPKLEKNNLQLHRSSWLFVAAISWYCIFFYDFVAKGTTMNCNANWHFSQKSFWSWLSRSIALYFYFFFFQCYKALITTKKIYIWNANPKGSAGNYFS